MDKILDSILPWIPLNSRVLDLACGDGSLLENLQRIHQVNGYGLEIDEKSILKCIKKGINVIEQDLDTGLSNFSDNCFDSVIMSQALQEMRHPHFLLGEMLRVGRECIITFPNFGHWSARCQLFFLGKMPVTRQLAYQWYETPNIHFFTYRDFKMLCEAQKIRILHYDCVAEGYPDVYLKKIFPNLFTQTAIFHLSL